MRKQGYGIENNSLLIQSATVGFFTNGNVIFLLNFCLQDASLHRSFLQHLKLNPPNTRSRTLIRLVTTSSRLARVHKPGCPVSTCSARSRRMLRRSRGATVYQVSGEPRRLPSTQQAESSQTSTWQHTKSHFKSNSGIFYSKRQCYSVYIKLREG